MVAGMERETEGNWGSLFCKHQHHSSLPIPVSGGPGITPAQRPGLLESGVKSVWETEDIADPVAKGSNSCDTFTIHPCDGQFKVFACDQGLSLFVTATTAWGTASVKRGAQIY